MKFLVFVLVVSSISYSSFAQVGDTVKIDQSKINTKVLRPGAHQYLVYIKNGKDSARTNFEFWTREIRFTNYKGKRAIEINQVWENNNFKIHTAKSICSELDFLPLYHESWWRSRGSFKFDFLEKFVEVNGRPLNSNDSATNMRNMYNAFRESLDQYVLNWHLDLEVFPLLPYKQGVTFLINFYDPGFGKPAWYPYSVVGSDRLKGINGETTDCWLLNHKAGWGNELFWINKKTREVIKLEQEYGGKYRYKVKLNVATP